MDRIGEGGMGVVYLARHETLGQRVAVKVLQPELSRDAEMVQRFFNEAQAATAIRNPGIVQVFDFGMAPDGRAYFVMELLEGHTLTVRLKHRRLDAMECCRIGRQVANVLQAAHLAGITHRDLKPDNLFLVPDPEVIGGERIKVLDFGIAKLAREAHGPGMTRTGSMMGTPEYMSPEQCRGAGAVDPRADIYSLGCILFEMVCGRPPFVGEGMGDILGAHLHVPAPDPRSLSPNVVPELAALIVHMLAKQPDARPQTMAAVSQALDHIVRTLSGPHARIPTPQPMAPLNAPQPLGSLGAPQSRRSEPPLPAPSPTPLPIPHSPSGPLPAAQSAPTPLPVPQSASTPTTLGGSAGMTSAPARTGKSRLPYLLGGAVVLGTIVAIAAVLAGGGAEPSERQIAYGDIPAAPPPPADATAAAAPVDAAVAAVPVPVPAVADAAAATPTITAGTGGKAEPSATADELEAECKGLQVDRKWAELEKCADKLAPLAPERAAQIKATAVEGKTAHRIAVFEAALRDKNLKRAKAELDHVPAGSDDHKKIRRKYAEAEKQAIADLAVELDRVKDADCEEYQELLATSKDTQPTRVHTEAARKAPCTATRCDADAAVRKAQDEEAKGRYAASLDAYDAAYRCRPDPRLVRKAFELACSNRALAKAKIFWKRMPPVSQAEAKISCARNGITEAQLNAP